MKNLFMALLIMFSGITVVQADYDKVLQSTPNKPILPERIREQVIYVIDRDTDQHQLKVEEVCTTIGIEVKCKVVNDVKYCEESEGTTVCQPNSPNNAFYTIVN
jgi:hypothetical protein